MQAARNKHSPLHVNFTWDVVKAANKCWHKEALYIIQAITLVTFKMGDVEKKDPIEVRAFIGVIDDYDKPHAGVSYFGRNEVFVSKNLSKKALKSAVLELKATYDKYQELTCLDHVWATIVRLNLKQLLSQL